MIDILGQNAWVQNPIYQANQVDQYLILEW